VDSPGQTRHPADVILMPVGSHGDVHPFVGVGRALAARGHRVTVVAAEPFAPLAREFPPAAGPAETAGPTPAGGWAEFVRVGTAEEYERFIRDPDLWHPSRSLAAVFRPEPVERAVRDGYRAIADRYRPGRTVVVAGTLAFAARIAHDALGVPLATVDLQPQSLLSAADPPVFPQASPPRLPAWLNRLAYRLADRFVIDPLVAPPVNRVRADLGLPPVRRVWTTWRHSPQRVLGLFPAWFASAPDWPPQARLTGFVRYDQAERPVSAAVEQFLNEGEPPVVVSFGSAMRQGRPYLAAAAEACRRLGRRGLLLAKGGEQVPSPLPAGVRHADYAPFSRVFPRAAAVVHHGGIGTTAQALAAGVPQLVMPLAFDQPDNAARVRRLGVARELRPRRFTPARVAAELEKLLKDPAVPAACRAAAAKMADDPLPRTCELIEELVGTDRPLG
jgi:UDP:flavonoid glycosyltransferase YjiC (YdhE family)